MVHISEKKPLTTILITLEGNRVSHEESNTELTRIIFPKRALLEPRDTTSESEIGVYTKQLRLGDSQIEPRYFDRCVLDRYKQDPRYESKEFSLSGRITVNDAQHLEAGDLISPQMRFMPASQQNGTPVVTAILYDLAMLPKKQQQHWNSCESSEECQPDPYAVKQNFDAEFVKRISRITAVLGEMREINKICRLSGEPNLFRETLPDYENMTEAELKAEAINEERIGTIDNMKRKLGQLTNPTADEFNSFVNELDKLLSQNINHDFFKGKLELANSKGDTKGTLTLLKEYLKVGCSASNDIIREVCEPLKEVRDIRIVPAHKMTRNVFNPTYWDSQINLVKKVLNSMHLLRKTLAEHFAMTDYIPPEWLSESRIE